MAAFHRALEEDPKQVKNDLENKHKAEVSSLKTKIDRLNEIISIKDRAIVRGNGDNSNLTREMSYFDEIKVLCQNQQIQIGKLQKKIATFVREHDIGTAAHV